MLNGKTASGFCFEIDKEILDDYDFLEILCQADEGDSKAMIKMVDKMLGSEQKEALKNHIRTEEGKVSAKRLFEEVSEILNATKEGKNS